MSVPPRHPLSDDQIRADIDRAIRAAFPDRADAILDRIKQWYFDAKFITDLREWHRKHGPHL